MIMIMRRLGWAFFDFDFSLAFLWRGWVGSQSGGANERAGVTNASRSPYSVLAGQRETQLPSRVSVQPPGGWH
jgi:hypothetical protein